MQDIIKTVVEDSLNVKRKLLDLTQEIESTGKILIGALRQEQKILVCGNGGSAADSQHMACELVGRFEKERRGLPCISLTTDSSILTAWTNDYDYESLFARQISALGARGDVLVGITTSGKSKNVVYAIEEARKKGMHVIALLGKDGGVIKNMPEVASIVVPSYSTPRIQECHIIIIHAWCKLIDEEFCC